MEETKRISFTELLYGVIFQPKVTFKRIAKMKAFFLSFLIIVGVNLLNNLSNFLIAEPFSEMPPNMPKQLVDFLTVFSSPGVAVLGAFISTVFTIMVWFLFSAIIQLISEFFGGKGTGIGVMTVLGFSTLPQALGVPFLILFHFLGLPSFVSIFISIPLAIWTQLVLPILGLREVQQFSVGRAILVMLTPMFLFFGLMLSLAIVFISLLLPVLQ